VRFKVSSLVKNLFASSCKNFWSSEKSKFIAINNGYN
jgi:hypothetical protein